MGQGKLNKFTPYQPILNTFVNFTYKPVHRYKVRGSGTQILCFLASVRKFHVGNATII